MVYLHVETIFRGEDYGLEKDGKRDTNWRKISDIKFVSLGGNVIYC